MLQVSRLARRQLGDGAERIVEYLHGELADDGGARDRSGKSDLYYTSFLLESFVALRAEPPRGRVRRYLEGFGDGEGLDLVHRACLVRAWASLGEGFPDTRGEGFAARAVSFVESHRRPDGGYGTRPDSEVSALYPAFLALGVHGDLGTRPPEPERLAASIAGLRCEDGGYADSMALPIGTTPTTAAAASLLRQLGQPAANGTDGAAGSVGAWLLRQAHPQGGFVATPHAPLPDLLSTATALHALSELEVPIDAVREPCLDFLDSLWTGRAFCSSWEDDETDCEYVFYALLALGHLSV